jgi:hypothetical protein
METAAPTAIGNGGKLGSVAGQIEQPESYARAILDATALLIDPHDFDPDALALLVAAADALEFRRAP